MMTRAVAHEHASRVRGRSVVSDMSDCALFLKHVLSGAGDTESLVSNAGTLIPLIWASPVLKP